MLLKEKEQYLNDYQECLTLVELTFENPAYALKDMQDPSQEKFYISMLGKLSLLKTIHETAATESELEGVLFEPSFILPKEEAYINFANILTQFYNGLPETQQKKHLAAHNNMLDFLKTVTSKCDGLRKSNRKLLENKNLELLLSNFVADPMPKKEQLTNFKSKIFPKNRDGKEDFTLAHSDDVTILRYMELLADAQEKARDRKIIIEYKAYILISILKYNAAFRWSRECQQLLKTFNNYEVLIKAHEISGISQDLDVSMISSALEESVFNNFNFLTKIDLLRLTQIYTSADLNSMKTRCTASNYKGFWNSYDRNICAILDNVKAQDDKVNLFLDVGFLSEIFSHRYADDSIKTILIDRFLNNDLSGYTYYNYDADSIVNFFNKIIKDLREDQLNKLKEKIIDIKKKVDATIVTKYDDLLDNIQKALDSKNSHLRVMLPEQVINAAMVAYNSITSLLEKLSSIAQDLYGRFTSWWQGNTQKKYSYFTSDETIKAVTSLVNYAFIQHLYNNNDSNIITFVEQNFNLNIFVENADSLSDQSFLQAVQEMLPRIDGDDSWPQAKLNKIQKEYIKLELEHAFDSLKMTSQRGILIAKKLSKDIFIKDTNTRKTSLRTDASLESLGAYFKYANDDKQLGNYFEDAIISDNPQLFDLMQKLKTQQQLFKMLHPDTGAFRSNYYLKQKIQNMYFDSQTQHRSLKIKCDEEKSAIFFEQLIKMVPDYYKTEIDRQSNGYKLPEITPRDVEVFQNHAKVFPQQILQHFIFTYKDISENIVALLNSKIKNIDNLLNQYPDSEWNSFVNGYSKASEIVYKTAFLESTKKLLNQTIKILHAIKEIAEHKREDYEQSFLQRNNYDDLIRDLKVERLLIEAQLRDDQKNENIYMASYNIFLSSLLQEDLGQAELGKKDIENALLKVTDDDIDITDNEVKKLLLANRKLEVLRKITPVSDWSAYRTTGFNLYLKKIREELQNEQATLLPSVAEQQARLDFANRENKVASLPYEAELKQIFQQDKNGKNHYDDNYKSLLQIEQKQQIDDIAQQAIVWFVANKLNEKMKFSVDQLIDIHQYLSSVREGVFLEIEEILGQKSILELRARFSSFFAGLSKEHQFNYEDDELLNLFKQGLLENIIHVKQNFEVIFKSTLDQLKTAIKDHNTNIALSNAFAAYKKQLIIRFQNDNLELPARGAMLMSDFFTKYADLRNHKSIQEQLDEMTVNLHAELKNINDTIDLLILSNLNVSMLNNQDAFVNYMRKIINFNEKEKIYITYYEALLKQKYNSLMGKINYASQRLSDDKKGNLAQAVTKKQYGLEESDFSQSLSSLPAGYSTNKVVRQIFINQYQNKIQKAVNDQLYEILEITNKDGHLQIIEKAVNFSIKYLEQQLTVNNLYDKLDKLTEELKNIQSNPEQIIKAFFIRLSKDKKAQGIPFNEQYMYVGFQSEYIARYKAVLLENIKTRSVIVAKLMVVDFVQEYQDQIIADSTLISYLDGKDINPINMNLPHKISNIVINSASSFYKHLSKYANIAAFQTEFERLLSSSLSEINQLHLANLSPSEALSKLNSHKPQSILEEDHFVYQELVNLVKRVLETRLTTQQDRQALKDREALLQQAIQNTNAANTYGNIESIKSKLVTDIENLIKSADPRHKDIYRQAIGMFDTQYQTMQQNSYDNFIEKDVKPIYTQITNLDKLADMETLYKIRTKILEQSEQLKSKYPSLKKQLDNILENVNQEINKKITALALQKLRLSPACVSLLQVETSEQVELHMLTLRNSSEALVQPYKADIDLLALSEWLSEQEKNANSRVEQIKSAHIQLIQDKWNNITKMLDDAKNISQLKTIQETKITQLLSELALVRTKYPAIDLINVTNIEQIVNATKTNIQTKLSKLYVILGISEDEQNDKQKILDKAVNWFIKHIKDIHEITVLSDDGKYNWLQLARQELRQNKLNVMSRFFVGLNRSSQNDNFLFAKEDLDYPEFDSKFLDEYQRKTQEEIDEQVTAISVSQAVSLLAEIKHQLAYHKTLVQKNDLQKFMDAVEQTFEDEDELSGTFSLHNIIINKNQLISALNNYFKDPSIKEKFRESLITSLHKLKKVEPELIVVQEEINKLQNNSQLEDCVYLQLLHITKDSLSTENASFLLDVHENIGANIGYITQTKPLTENVIAEEMTQRVTKLALEAALSEYKEKLNLQFSKGNINLPTQQIKLSKQFLDSYPLAAPDVQAQFNEKVTSFNNVLQKIHDDIEIIISAQLQANLLGSQEDFVKHIMLPALIRFDLVGSADRSLYEQYLTILLNDKYGQLNKMIVEAANSSVLVEIPASYKNNSIILQAIANKNQTNMQQMRRNKLYNILQLGPVVEVHHDEMINKAVQIAIDIFNESILSQDPYVRFETLQQELIKVEKAKNYQPSILDRVLGQFRSAESDNPQSISENFFEILTKNVKFNPERINFNVNDVYKNFGKDFTDSYYNALIKESTKQVPLIAKLLIKDFLQQHRDLITQDHDSWVMFVNGESLDAFKFNLPKKIGNITVNSDIADRLTKYIKVSDFEWEFRQIMLQGLGRMGSFNSGLKKGLGLEEIMFEVKNEILKIGPSTPQVEDVIYRELLIIKQQLLAKKIAEETSKEKQALAEAEKQRIARKEEQAERDAQFKLKQEKLQLANAKQALVQLAYQETQVIVEKNDISKTTELPPKKAESKELIKLKRKAEIAQLAKSIMDQPFIKGYFISPMSFFKPQHRILKDPLLALNPNITLIEDTFKLYFFATYIKNEVEKLSKQIKDASQDQLVNIEMKLNKLFKELDEFLISINRSFKHHQEVLYISDTPFNDKPEKNVTTDSDSDYAHDDFNKSSTDTGVQQSSDFSGNSNKFDTKERLSILERQSKQIVNSASVSILESVMFYMYYMYNITDSKRVLDQHKLNILEKYLPINTSSQLYELIKELKPFNDEKKNFAPLDLVVLEEINVILQDINNFYQQVDGSLKDLLDCKTAESFIERLNTKFIVRSRYMDSLRTFKRTSKESLSTTRSEEFIGEACDSVAIFFIKSHIDYFWYKCDALAKSLGVNYKKLDYMDMLQENEAYPVQEYDDYETHDEVALKIFKELLPGTLNNKDKLNRINQLLRSIHPVLDEEGIPKDKVMMIPSALVTVLENLGYSDILITEYKHIGNVINSKYIDIIIALEKLLKLEQEKLVQIRDFAQTLVNQNKPMLSNQYTDKVAQQIFEEFYLDAMEKKTQEDLLKKKAEEKINALKELKETATDNAADHNKVQPAVSKPTINHQQEHGKQKQSEQRNKITKIINMIKNSQNANHLLDNINTAEKLIQQEKINLNYEHKQLISSLIKDMTVQFINNCNTPHTVFDMLSIIEGITKSILINEIDINHIISIRNATIMKYARGR